VCSVRVRVRVRVCVFIWVGARVTVCVCVFTRACICVRVRVCVLVCVCTGVRGCSPGSVSLRGVSIQKLASRISQLSRRENGSIFLHTNF